MNEYNQNKCKIYEKQQTWQIHITKKVQESILYQQQNNMGWKMFFYVFILVVMG